MPVKQQVGVVISNKMQKTIVVKIENRYPHPIYSKTLIKTKKYLAHDELETCNIYLSIQTPMCAKIIAQFNSSTLPFHVKVKVSIIKNWPRVKLKVNLPKHLPACSIAMLRCYNK